MFEFKLLFFYLELNNSFKLNNLKSQFVRDDLLLVLFLCLHMRILLIFRIATILKRKKQISLQLNLKVVITYIKVVYA
jgi:hypothetical protein